jgi:hypothetical protein
LRQDHLSSAELPETLAKMEALAKKLGAGALGAGALVPAKR